MIRSSIRCPAISNLELVLQANFSLYTLLRRFISMRLDSWPKEQHRQVNCYTRAEDQVAPTSKDLQSR